MAQRTDAGDDHESLTETHVALMLRHADDLAIMPAVEDARHATVCEWQRDDEHSEKLARLRNNEHYDFDVLGWEIYDDYGQTPAVRMVVLTPVPDWEESDLDAITREFIHAWKARTIQFLDALRQQAVLSPSVFTALVVDVIGDGEVSALAEPLGRTPDQLRGDLDSANAAADPVVDDVLYGNGNYAATEEAN